MFNKAREFFTLPLYFIQVSAFIFRDLLTEMQAQKAVMMIPKRKTEPPVMASSCQPKIFHQFRFVERPCIETTAQKTICQQG